MFSLFFSFCPVSPPKMEWDRLWKSRPIQWKNVKIMSRPIPCQDFELGLLSLCPMRQNIPIPLETLLKTYGIHNRLPDLKRQELTVCSTRCPHRHKLRQQCYLLYIWLPHTVTFNPYLYVEDSWNCTFMSFLLQHRVFYDTVVVFSVEPYCRVLLKKCICYNAIVKAS